MKRYSKSATLLLLLLCGTEYTTTRVSALKKKIQPSPSRTTSNKSNNSIPTKTKLFKPKQYADRRRVIPWISIVVLVNILFFFRSFAAPFFDPLGEPRQATADTVYFSLLAFLYLWLASVTALTVLPQFSTNYNIIIAVALFFYMVFVSICALLLGRLLTRGSYYIWLFIRSGNTFESILVKLGWKKKNTNRQQIPKLNGKNKVAFKEANNHQFPTLIAFQRPFRRVVKKAILISASLCFIYSHCWSRSLSAFDSSEHGRLFCRVAFFPFDNPASENSIWILWAISICGHVWAYVLNEFAEKHHRDYHTRSSAARKNNHGAVTLDMAVSNSSSSFDLDSPIHQVDSNNDFEDSSIGEDEEDMGITTHETDNKNPLQSIIQKFARKKPEQPINTLPMVSWYSNVVFTTGFDMIISFKVFLGRFDARKMQVALLGSAGDSSGKAEGVFDFSHCRHHTDSSADKGFWFDFVSDVGDGFNSSYQVSRLLAQPTLDVNSLPQTGPGWRTLPRGRLLINGGDLAYPDPTPENYEKRFFRTFEDALPPPPSFRREHISTHKPALPVEGWDMKEEDTSDEQPETESLLSRYQGPCAFLIPGNHDWFDGLSTFTRYILSRDWLGGWLMPQRTSYFALQLPKGWWALGFDLALDDDINIEQFQFFADVAKSMKPNDAVIVISHVPHWVLNAYENYRHDDEKENNLTELIRTHFKGRVKLRIAGDLHHYTKHVPVIDVKPMPNGKGKDKEAPILIVSGGGGAFLHPTHCFQEDQIKVGGDDYKRVAAYPSTNVSLQLSWLNLWQFRWRNWRLDVLWAVTHSGVSSSLFPLCGVYDDYLASNPTHNLGGLLLWAFRRVMILFSQIFKQGRISLLFSLIIIGIAYSFTDGSCLKMRTHLLWSGVHAAAQISSAVVCLLFVEFMVELVVSEGLVATTRNVGDSDETQMCGTGLANTIFDEWDTHFSHTLEDFQLLNITNTTSEPPDLIQSSRFDEQMYEWVSSTFSWLYHEAPFLKSTLSIFDLPTTIGSMHVEMCNVLCSDGTDCLYSNDFSRYQQLGRGTILKYLCSMALYYVIFAVPLAGNVCGSWLHISLNYLRCQYDEGFSSLRMEHWKNFLKLHIDEEGDLEIFAVGLHRVPKKWGRDPDWDGGDDTATSIKPSWKWENPSKWIPWRSRKKFTPQMIDYTKIKRKE